MRIKRFMAADMRTALHQVREEQGDQAVILSSHRTANGVEVVAATDYDELLVRQFLQAPASSEIPAPASVSPPSPKRMEPRVGLPYARDAETVAGRLAPKAQAGSAVLASAPASTKSAANTAMSAPGRGMPPEKASAAAATAVKPARPAAPTQAGRSSPLAAASAAAVKTPGAATPQTLARPSANKTAAGAREKTAAVVDPAIISMRRELSAMRQLIQSGMARINDERLRAVPARAVVLDELEAYGCEPDLARSIAANIPANADRAKARGMMLGLLSKSLLIAPEEPLKKAGVIALVGPTGVGKTTTIAKLAGRYAKMHSARDVALVTIDSGVGGRAQLVSYGRKLGMPVFEPRGADGLRDTLARLADYPLVLIDTAGYGQRDQALAEQFGWMNDSRRVRTYLALPATAQAGDLDEVIRRFRCAAPEGLILTKLDETGRLGNSMSVMVRSRLPLAYVTDGQSVPEDIHRAEAHRLVLRMGELRRDAARKVIQEVTHALA